MTELGYRICLKIQESSETKKYFIYVNLKDIETIRDLEMHIMRTFNISNNINLFIGDVCLPSNENIMVISPEDILDLQVQRQKDKDMVHQVMNKDTSYISGNFNSYQANEPKKKDEINIKTCEQNLRSPKKDCRASHYSGLALYLNMLKSENSDKEESRKLGTPKEKNIKIDNGEVIHVENVETEYQQFENDLGRKRKRKRKHKQNLENEYSLNQEVHPKSEVIIPPKTNKHMYFDQSIEETTKATEENGAELYIINNSTDVNNRSAYVNNEEVKESSEESLSSWKGRILSMANSINGSPLFQRTDVKVIDICSSDDSNDDKIKLSQQNLDPSMYPIVSSVNKNDFILFKVLALGKDYCPNITKDILGKVKSVDEESNNLEIIIIKGKEEFSLPEGKLSLKVNDEPPPKYHVEKMRFEDLIEPRLLFP